MKKKLNYTAPETETLEVRMESHFLDGSVASVKGSDVSGWSSTAEDW